MGDYVRTRSNRGTKVRCKAYSLPTLNHALIGEIDFPGEFLESFDPGTYLGPIKEIRTNTEYVAILVKEGWVNVSKGYNAFAFRVPDRDVRRWEANGWIHEELALWCVDTLPSGLVRAVSSDF